MTNHSYVFDTIPVTYETKDIRGTDNTQELLHYQDSVELIYVKKGNIHCHVNNSDFPLGKGDICFINEEMLHRVYCDPHQDADLEVLSTCPSVFTASQSIYEQYIRPVIQDPDFTHIRSDRNTAAAKSVSHLLEEIDALITGKPEGYELDVLGLVCMIFRRLYLIHENQTDPEPMDRDAMIQRKMTSYIYAHYSEKISLNDIAASAGISRSKAAQLFQKYADTTPVSFLNQFRLETGANMLKTTSLPIGEIAYQCGFNEQSYFNRQFVKTYGMTPVAYRKQNAV